MSTPESDRLKRKEALKEARHKLAVRKKQREELRAQRAARLAGKIDTTISTSSTMTTALNVGKGRQSVMKKQTSLLTFMNDFDDIKEDKKCTAPNKASLLRAPRIKSSLIIGRLKNYNYTPIKTVETWDKWTQTDFNMFSQYLIEEYSEEFPNKESMTDEVKSNLILSKYKIGWPKELWIHEKSLSPSPQNLMYDDDEYIEQQKTLQKIRKQEKERKDRQKILIQQRRIEKIKRKNRKVLPKNEANLLENRGTFMINFRKKTKWMERALGINSIHFNCNFIDITKGITIIEKEEEIKEEEEEMKEEEINNNNNNKIKVKQLLKYINKFTADEEETKQRAVGDINFCNNNSDWFLASYYRENIGETTFYNDGFMLIWNLILPKFPEYKLYSESMITSCHFHPIDKFLVYAATTSGQILCYDLRNGNQSKPIQRTNFIDGHNSSIFSMDFLQSVSGGNRNKKSDRKRHLLSVSNDGKLCIFKDDGLSEKPMHEGILQINDKNTKSICGNSNENSEQKKQSHTQMITGGSSSSQELSTTCFGYQYKHSDNLIFGSDSGKLYRTDIHNNNNKGVNDIENSIFVQECIDAHFGPITNIDFPTYNSNYSYSNNSNLKYHQNISGLYLTSSYDWTVKLWHNDYNGCLETYTTQNDYVYDVKWLSGGKPGLFVSCDGDQKLNLFDLKYDFKQPINTIKVNTDNDNDALTKLNWGNNGKYLCTGDSNGNIYLYLTDNKLLYPTQTDFDSFNEAITGIFRSRGLTKRGK